MCAGKARIISWLRLMPLHEDRIKLTDKRLTACRDCSSVADVSIQGSKREVDVSELSRDARNLGDYASHEC